MKIWIPALFSVLTLLGSPIVSATPQSLDHVVAIVNNGVILQTDIDTAMKTVKANAGEKGQPLPPADVLKEQVLEKLVLDEIQLQEAKRMGIQIDDQRLDQAIQSIAKENGQTLEQLTASLQLQGLTYPVFREQIRKEMAVSEARNAQVRRRVNISPSEVETLAALLAERTTETVEYKIAQIQLHFSDDKEATEQQAEELVSRLKQGEDFSTLAYTYSKGPKALQGGDWGWMRKEEMPTIFADQITTQGRGAIIGPFRSGVGFHILMIQDVKGLETVAVTEVNAQHILIKPSIILSDEGAKKELDGFIEQINSGKRTFGELAQQYSQDPGSAVANGILGFQTADNYVPEFKHQVETLPIGQISPPFKTVHGWHIVKVLDRRSVDKTESAMKNRAYQILFKRKFNEEAGAWLQEIRASAYVEVLDKNNEQNNNDKG
ncbi:MULTISPECIES: peptidylprolyl isomerase SurA [Vibrio]|uniref:Chaperone SurA n=1 Tax=Vibrio casei TaxID=673372 RepID=A0A368LKZ2_9VIBR|nr:MULTISPECIES: peptidylprolyl isomerase SurA [Vibrio]RCS72465.1 peptidylprolyl isomerase SurA [Vibrio casei]SJN36572.1 Survival protein SurA precursor (Peptidyl-prolyl cis-trans isomerase SurA) [Vibrio casei]HBV75196.1 peptidylprolyl isomerase SurA [Vibrio sp.]